ncbi:MAG TPA: carbon storage regulator CsrA [bacterium]|nr:carbon storage regulator CsrA [bacterium]HQL63738.1 carbon storage regulator CsrA [bacterium]
MLVLSRKRDESIIVGDNVVITIIDIKGEHVKLGVDAPKYISIHRKEVYEAIQAENLAASRPEAQNLESLAKVLAAKTAQSDDTRPKPRAAAFPARSKQPQ